MLRHDLRARLQTPRFWTDYLHFTEPEWPGDAAAWAIDFDLGASVGLNLDIRYPISATYLEIRDLGELGVPVEVAWDDQAHWHPHVFRWPELDAVCRRIAKRLEGEGYAHPGLPLLLLYRFAPLTSEAEYRQYGSMIETAWRELALFTTDEIASFIDRVDYRNQGVEWSYADGIGWTVDQVGARAERELYSLRVRGNGDFPFDLWNKLMSEIAGDMSGA